MARIVLGLGSSHTPMLLVDAADLPRYEENDRRLPLLDTNGAPTTFDAQLTAAGGGPDVTPEALTARHTMARQAIAGLADALAGAALDALIVIGDDQQEMLKGDRHPALMVYDRPTMRSQRRPHPPGRPEWVLRGSDRYYPADGPRDYPVAVDLAGFLGAQLRAEGLEVGDPPFDRDDIPMGHAYAFICSQLMSDPPIPIVPVLLNALYPPNQPTPAQCLAIGQAIARAVNAFPGNARVGVVASGGLSHFVVDEDLDQAVIQAVTRKDHAALAALPVEKLNSGSAEIRNWICAAAALSGLAIDRIDYIPGYRTRASTGTGLGFAIWR